MFKVIGIVTTQPFDQLGSTYLSEEYPACNKKARNTESEPQCGGLTKEKVNLPLQFLCGKRVNKDLRNI